MNSETLNPSSFKTKIQKKMLHLRNLEAFGTQTINMLLKINLSIDIASQYIDPVKKLLDIGIICDPNIISFQKDILSKFFYVSSFLLEKCLKKESLFPIKPFSTEELSDEFLSLITNNQEKVQNWLYFYIPFSIDSFHIQKLIEKKKCGIQSILKNKQEEIENVLILKNQFNLDQSIFRNFQRNDRKEFNSKKVPENSIKNSVFMKELHHQLPNKVENEVPNNPVNNNNSNTLIFRVIFGDINDDLVANIDQTEPTLESIVTDNSTIWKPFVL